MIAMLLGAALAALPTPDSELEACQAFLATHQVPLDAVPYIQFFTNYAADTPELLAAMEATLPFTLNSLMTVDAPGYIVKPRRVPGSTTLWYVDIRDLGWDREDVDAVASLQPYFLAPLVDKPGSILFRTDWCMVNVWDPTWQADRGQEKILPYYVLQYGLGHEPRNGEDFRKYWLVDLDTVKAHSLDHGTVVPAGESGVSRHTRFLRRARTVLGYYWDTRDVKSHDLDVQEHVSRDYVEDLFANQADAQEYIVTNKVGLQTYLLTAGNNDDFKRIEFGDPTVVVDRSDSEDVRVRNGKSCVVCHMGGINKAPNHLKEFFETEGADLKAYYEHLSQQIRAFYLHDLDAETEADNAIFVRAVKECNGLTPEANLEAFVRVYDWYRKPVTLEQAAREIGLEVEKYRETIRPTTTGRLAFLFLGKAMPRDIWDSPNAGGYVQSMLLHKKIEAGVPAEVTIAANNTPLYRAGTNHPLVYLRAGDRVKVVADRPGWWWVEYERWRGFVRKEQCQ